VIGATEKAASVGRTVLRNLLAQPSGATIFPVNPGRTNVLGIRCYPTVAAIGELVDLAILITPAATVHDVLGECVDAGVRATPTLFFDGRQYTLPLKPEFLIFSAQDEEEWQRNQGGWEKE